MTRSFLISYDLKGSRNYDALYAAIRAYGQWAHITESLWFIKTASDTSAIYHNLIAHLDRDDALFVICVNREATWQNVICEDKYLQDNL